MDILSDKIVKKSRKQHQCDLCYEMIEKGESYQTQTNVVSGDLGVFKSHIQCSQIASKLDMYNECIDGLDGDAFVEIITDKYCQLREVKQADIWVNRTVKLPPFKERLEFVIDKILTK